MTLLDTEESLIVHVARATCFTYRLDRKNTPREDLDVYIDELLRLYAAKPLAKTATRPDDQGSDVRFGGLCATTGRRFARTRSEVASGVVARLNSGALTGPSG